MLPASVLEHINHSQYDVPFSSINSVPGTVVRALFITMFIPVVITVLQRWKWRHSEVVFRVTEWLSVL